MHTRVTPAFVFSSAAVITSQPQVESLEKLLAEERAKPKKDYARMKAIQTQIEKQQALEDAQKAEQKQLQKVIRPKPYENVAMTRNDTGRQKEQEPFAVHDLSRQIQTQAMNETQALIDAAEHERNFELAGKMQDIYDALVSE